MKIYFAGSIRGGRDDIGLYHRLIERMRAVGEVLTEHVGRGDLTPAGEEGLSDRQIHDRDIGWLAEADAVVAEVSTPSLGVGYEIALAARQEKPLLCLFRPRDGKSLSAMIAGCPSVELAEYDSPEAALARIDAFLKALDHA